MTKFLVDNRKIILFFLTIICTISFIDTFKKGMLNGCDFQWQPSVLFWQGINHYEKFIANGNWDFMCQGGQYSQLFQSKHSEIIVEIRKLTYLHVFIKSLYGCTFISRTWSL